MGTSLATSLLEEAYNGYNVIHSKNTFTDLCYDYEDTASVYFMTGQKFFATSDEADALMSFVKRGNTVFIAAQEIDTTILQLVNCVQYSMNPNNEQKPSDFLETNTSLVKSLGADYRFQYFYLPLVNFFKKDTYSAAQTVGYNAFQEPNLIVNFHGTGALYLHADPRALSNYFLFQKNNYQYFNHILQMLPKNPEHVYIDDHYSKINYRGKEKSNSLLGFIYSNPALAWAFTILLIAFLLYVLINGKRRQRVVPVIKPTENASVAFAEAIAGLYRKEKENKSIAEKMITYFYEEIRTKYFINTSKVTEDFLTTLSRKAGTDLTQTKDLFYTITMIQDSPEVSDDLLLQLNQKIQQFKNSKA